MTDFQVFCSPFVVNSSDLFVDFQLEIIDLQCDSDLKTKFALATLDTFYRHVFSGYSKVTSLTTNVLCMLGTTYLCEQVFFVININKTKLRSRLTHSHLNDILKVPATQDLTPDLIHQRKLKVPNFRRRPKSLTYLMCTASLRPEIKFCSNEWLLWKYFKTLNACNSE